METIKLKSNSQAGVWLCEHLASKGINVIAGIANDQGECFDIIAESYLQARSETIRVFSTDNTRRLAKFYVNRLNQWQS